MAIGFLNYFSFTKIRVLIIYVQIKFKYKFLLYELLNSLGNVCLYFTQILGTGAIYIY